MFPHPRRPEIDHRTMKLIVGLIALSLANLTSFFANTSITSISASYWEGGWSRDIFVGFLFAISAFLFAYNGYTAIQMILSKVAAVAALCIALFPCSCPPPPHPETIPGLHAVSAAVMFGILAFFCYVFFRRALGKVGPQAKSRAVIYALCGLAIVASILILLLDDRGIIKLGIPRLTFYGEKTSLIAFGVSWLTASHWLPFLSSETDRPWARVQQPLAPGVAAQASS